MHEEKNRLKRRPFPVHHVRLRAWCGAAGAGSGRLRGDGVSGSDERPRGGSDVKGGSLSVVNGRMLPPETPSWSTFDRLVHLWSVPRECSRPTKRTSTAEKKETCRR